MVTREKRSQKDLPTNRPRGGQLVPLQKEGRALTVIEKKKTVTGGGNGFLPHAD